MENRKINGGAIRSIINKFVISCIAVLLALLVSSIFISIVGENPIKVYYMLLQGAFGSPTKVGIMLKNFAPLLLVGVGVSFAFRCNLVNLGGNGQIYMGGLACSLIALYVHGLPPVLHVLLCFVAGFVGGALWGAIAGLLKSFLGLNEMITTIMLNYVAMWLVSFLVHGVMMDPDSFYAWTAKVPKSIRLFVINKGADANIGFIVAIVLAIIVHIILFKTTFGYQVRASGFSEQGAKFVGINVNQSVVKAMVLSGGLAGIAGTVELLGNQLRLSDFFAANIGFDAIAVAFLAQASPIGAIISAFFLAAISSGADSVSRITSIPDSVSDIIQGVILLFILISGSEKLRKKPLIKRKSLYSKKIKEGI